jgi:hypothetical protein
MVDDGCSALLKSTHCKPQHGSGGAQHSVADECGDTILNQVIFGSRHKSVGGEKIWEAGKIRDAGKKRDPAFTCANMFWWYNIRLLEIEAAG